MKNILITGASSGLGTEFARQYASAGTRLFLTGRNTERLEDIAKACKALGSDVHIATIDVTDRASMQSYIDEITTQYGLDLVIANAGIGLNWLTPDDVKNDHIVFDINLGGVINTTTPALPHMMKKKSGQIVIISSLAGLLPFPTAPAYSASKAAVRFYGEALRSKIAASGVKVTVICPGFIRSRMTDANNFKMPFFMETDVAVRHMIQGIESGKPRIIFPWQLATLLEIAAKLPQSLIGWTLSKLPDKKG